MHKACHRDTFPAATLVRRCACVRVGVQCAWVYSVLGCARRVLLLLLLWLLLLWLLLLPLPLH